MLRITIPGGELWDEERQEFIFHKETKLQLEHSLVSLSKWESKWHKPYLTKEDKTVEETIDYIRCMTLTQNVDSTVYYRLTEENIDQIINYINDPMTATTINERGKASTSKEQVTSELVYYWMIALQIPVEFQKWHLNRLLTLIRVCEVKNTPPKKRSKADIMRSNAELNAKRRQMLNTKG